MPNFLTILLTVAALAGLLLGSFLNVCIVRLPKGLSVVRPGSHCPACGSAIRPWENIPLFSWFCLRGQCSRCHTRISLQYPLVELGTAALFVACVVHTGPAWQTLIDAIACFLLLGLAVMDAQTMLLPDAFTLSGLAIAFVLHVIAPGEPDHLKAAWHTAENAAIAAALLLVVSFAYRLIRKREGMGLGDVKLLAMMAALLGLHLALLAAFLAVIVAAVFALALLASRKVTAAHRIAFGSFLAASGILTIFIGKPLLAWYLGLF